jgi:hypothetical protein
VLELSEGIALRAIPRYSDIGTPGDDRITLMLMSAGGRHSPLMTQIDDATARALLAALGG